MSMAEKVYLTFLLIGIFYAVVSLVLGKLFDAEGAELDLDGMDFDGGFFSFLTITPATVVIFLTVLGGSGLIFHYYHFHWILALVISLLISISAYIAFCRYVLVPLSHFERKGIAVSENDAEGTVGEVVETIPSGGFGKISYKVRNNIFNAPAREFSGNKMIRKGKKVLIIKVEKHVYYVREYEGIKL